MPTHRLPSVEDPRARSRRKTPTGYARGSHCALRSPNPSYIRKTYRFHKNCNIKILQVFLLWSRRNTLVVSSKTKLRIRLHGVTPPVVHTRWTNDFLRSLTIYTEGAKKCIHILRIFPMYYVYTFFGTPLYILRTTVRLPFQVWHLIWIKTVLRDIRTD
jgi:hypothetical protein